MPVAKLRAKKKEGRAVVERQSPEPRNRVLRREMVLSRTGEVDRHVSKQRARQLAEEWPPSRFPQQVTE